MTDQRDDHGADGADGSDPTALLERAVLAGALPELEEPPIDVDAAIAELTARQPGADEAAGAVDADTQVFAHQIADSAASFLISLRAIAREQDAGRAISMLLLEISQVLLAGARLGAQRDFTPRGEYQPDIGPDSDLDELRMRLAAILEPVDTYSLVFDPYAPEVVESQLSDDLCSIALDLETGLRHFREGNTEEALWWWQFSYVSSWGNLAGAALNALLSVVSHDRLDREVPGEDAALAAADAMLAEQLRAREMRDGGSSAPR